MNTITDVSNNQNPIEQMPFTDDKCFICGKKLTSNNCTVEHIFPKWLQNKFNLWHNELYLLNGTKIPYWRLTVPCCKECNNTLSECIEHPFEQAVSGGYNKFVELDRKIIFQWVNKISYGLKFKELSLKTNLKDSKSSPIYSKEKLKQNYMQHVFLKSIIDNSKYENPPYSLLIFKLYTKNTNNPFDVVDDLSSNTFCIRMNNIGIIVHLLDNGMQEKEFISSPKTAILLKKELHPIQYSELCAIISYKSILYYTNPFFLLICNDKNRLETIVPISSPDISTSKNWNQKLYSQILEKYWRFWKVKKEDIYIDANSSMSIVYDIDGNFIDPSKIIISEYCYPPGEKSL